MNRPRHYTHRTAIDWHRIDTAWQIDVLKRELDAIDATAEMRLLAAQVYYHAGYQHALATVRGWSET